MAIGVWGPEFVIQLLLDGSLEIYHGIRYPFYKLWFFFLEKQRNIFTNGANWNFLIVVHVCVCFPPSYRNIANLSTQKVILHFPGSQEQCLLSLAFSTITWQQEEGGGGIKTSNYDCKLQKAQFWTDIRMKNFWPGEKFLWKRVMM